MLSIATTVVDDEDEDDDEEKDGIDDIDIIGENDGSTGCGVASIGVVVVVVVVAPGAAEASREVRGSVGVGVEEIFWRTLVVLAVFLATGGASARIGS